MEKLLEAVKSLVSDLTLEQTGAISSEIADLKQKINSGVGRPSETIVVSELKEPTKIEGITHNQFETILKLTNLKLNVMLVGPAGSGKNHIAEQVAKALNLNFYPVQKVSEEFALKGFMNAQGEYVPTTFYKAFKDGGVFFLDEMDASSPDALIVLNAALANGYFDFPIGRIDAHEEFRVIAGANTIGTGADNIYTARNAIDSATLDRFEVVIINYDKIVELQMASGNKTVYNLVKKTRTIFNQIGLEKIVSPRTTASIAKMIANDVVDLTGAWTLRIWNKLDESEKELFKANSKGSEVLNELKIK